MSTNQQQKILVVAPSWVGDTVMAQSLLKLLKIQNPLCSIDVLANEALHPLLKCMPEVNNCITLPFNHGDLKLFARFKFAKKLRNNFYTHAYILPNSFKSVLIPFWAKIPNRIGWLGEFRYILLNNIKTGAKKIPRFVDRLIALGTDSPKDLAALSPKLDISIKQRSLSVKKLNITLTQKPILAICPGAEYGPAKRWPTHYFAEIAKIKHNDGWDVWIFGGPKDKIHAQEIQNLSNNVALDLTGKTNLEEAIDILSLATLAITNDSGLMHIAAACDILVIAIYGSSSLTYTPPLTKKAQLISLNLPCSPCFKRTCPLKHTQCLYNIKPQMVLQAINKITS